MVISCYLIVKCYCIIYTVISICFSNLTEGIILLTNVWMRNEEKSTATITLSVCQWIQTYYKNNVGKIKPHYPKIRLTLSRVSLKYSI